MTACSKEGILPWEALKVHTHTGTKNRQRLQVILETIQKKDENVC